MDDVAGFAFGQTGLSAQAGLSALGGRIPLTTVPQALAEDDTSLSVRLSAAGKPSNAFEAATARQVRVLDTARVADTTSFPGAPLGVNTSSVEQLAQSLLLLSFDALYDNVRPAARRAVESDFDPRTRSAPDIMRAFINPLAYVVRVSAVYAPYVGDRPGNRPGPDEFEHLIADLFGQTYQDTASNNDRIGMFLFALLVLRHELSFEQLPRTGVIDLLWLGVLLGPEKTPPAWRAALATLNSDLVDALPLDLPAWGFYWFKSATAPAASADRLRTAVARLRVVPRYIFDVVADSVDLSLLPLKSTPLVGGRLAVRLPATGMHMRWYAVLVNVHTARDAAQRQLLPGQMDLDASRAWGGYVFDLGDETPILQAPPFPFVIFGLGRAPGDTQNKYAVTRMLQVYPMARCSRCHDSGLLLAGVEEKRSQCRWDLEVLQPYNPLDELREAHYTLVWHWNRVRMDLSDSSSADSYTMAQQAEAAIRFWESPAQQQQQPPLLRSTFENIARELWYIALERERVGRPARHEAEIQYARGLLMLRERQRVRFPSEAPSSSTRYIGQHSIETPNPDFLLLENDLDNTLIIVADTSRATVVLSDGPSQVAMTEILLQLDAYQQRVLPGLRERTAPRDADDLFDPYASADRATRQELLDHYVKVKEMADRFNSLLAAPNPYVARVPDFDAGFANELAALRQ